METWDVLARLLVGTGLAAILGLEREVTGKAAGLRTHAMVGLGAALFTVLSQHAFSSADSSRVAAQIVSGIGFLGAGAIFRSGALVKGLTTAAGLWAAAAIGMAAGAGQESWATLGAGVAVLVLLALRYVDGIIGRFRTGVQIEVQVEPAAEFLEVRDNLISMEPGAALEGARPIGDDGITLTFVVPRERVDMLRAGLTALPVVVSVEQSGST